MTKSPLDFFTSNVDSWGAREWFQRLREAVVEHDQQVVLAHKDGETKEVREAAWLRAEMLAMVVSSSAFRLGRDFPHMLDGHDKDGYELRTFRVVYYAEHGLMDGGAYGRWEETLESHPFPTRAEADAWLKLNPNKQMMGMQRVREALEPEP